MFSGPITERDIAKTKQSRITLDTQLKIIKKLTRQISLSRLLQKMSEKLIAHGTNQLFAHLFLCGLSLFVGLCVRRVFELMLGVVLAYLSIPVVQNLLSSRQAMNTSFDSFRIVNTYGAFGRYFK